ncbi:hypothetical protein QVD17_39449 [Tagetes erecta]|uniref:Uncharacterized protein n=1 Tax=Tagetes erecta TaxID=13708 RepID=A0AAD8NG85_TARER|nr:hypothetical protein QVD17_39449 [Tagetes erecta]
MHFWIHQVLTHDFLDDIDNFINVKKEPVPTTSKLSAPPTPKAQAETSKKRKVVELNPFDGLATEDVYTRLQFLIGLDMDGWTVKVKELGGDHVVHLGQSSSKTDEDEADKQVDADEGGDRLSQGDKGNINKT